MKQLLILFCLFILRPYCFSQHLEILFDISNAEKTLEILKSGDITDRKVEELVSLRSTRGLLIKIGEKDVSLASALQNAIKDIPLINKEAAFQYDLIKMHRDSLSVFVNNLISNKKKLEIDLINFLKKYIPKNLNKKITVYGIMGGNSIGYTLGDDSSFYISLHHTQYDMNAVFEICKHELFHNLQVASYNPDSIAHLLNAQKAIPENNAYYLISSLFTEGTATYVADIEKAIPSRGIQFFVDEAKRNKNRLYYTYYMFDRSLVDAYNHPESVDIDLLYAFFFNIDWDECGYYMGKHMTSYLLKGTGEEGLNKYLQNNPLLFISDYIKKSNEDKSNSSYRFSKEFQNIISKVQQRIDVLAKPSKPLK